MSERVTMTPQQLVETIYLGDRACKVVTIDGWNAAVRVQVDCISRIRSSSGNWDNYTAEDIPDGLLVFSGVRRIEMKNNGFVPNDLINSLKFVGHEVDAAIIELSIDSVDSEARHHETKLRITCESMHLEHPDRPGVQLP